MRSEAKRIAKKAYTGKLERLRSEFGKNKSLPKEFELAGLISLTKFPELKDVKIDVRYGRIKTTMEARPTLLSVFRKKSKRKYKIVINSQEKKMKKAALKRKMTGKPSGGASVGRCTIFPIT